jgi:hypothetical protein
MPIYWDLKKKILMELLNEAIHCNKLKIKGITIR